MIAGNVLDGLLNEARPNPDDEIRRHKERPRCDICGEEVGDDMWEILGYIVCEACIDDACRATEPCIVATTL